MHILKIDIFTSEINREYLLFEVNTEYISSNELKISAYFMIENADIFNA